MIRKRTALSAALIVGALLWIVVAWPVLREPPESSAVALPVPSAPAEVAEVHIATHAPEQERAKADPPAASAAVPAIEARSDVPAMGDQHLLVMEEMFSQPQGPLEAYRQSHQAEPRDSGANEAEARVRAAFEPEQPGYWLLRSELCRQTICRLELNWRAWEMSSYVAAMRRTDADFEQEFAALEIPGSRSAAGRLVELYLKRKR